MYEKNKKTRKYVLRIITRRDNFRNRVDINNRIYMTITNDRNTITNNKKSA